MKKIEEIGAAVIDASLMVHRELGPGLLESAYERCLAFELIDRGYVVDVQKEIPLQYRNIHITAGFRADLIIENSVLIELKSVEALLPIHSAQILTYLRLSRLHLGYLINFNVPLIKNGIKR